MPLRLPTPSTVLTLVLCLFLTPLAALAQDSGKTFTAQAYALDVQTLAGANSTISLWGIEGVYERGTPENTRARAYLEDIMGGRPLSCVTMGGSRESNSVRARCLNAEQRDIALMMVSSGLATVSRRDVAGSELASAYMGAERQARMAKAGVWSGGTVAAPSGDAQAGDGNIMSMIGGTPAMLVGGALVFIPLLGFIIIGFIMQMGFRQLISLQKYQIAGTQKRERQLKEREKYVIASALENELMTNRAKLDAFLVIYEELLKSLRDPAKKPKYQRAGDIIHEKPALNRTVFDSHVDKLDLLGPQLSSELTSLYNMVVPNPDYRTLEPELPIERAREQVDRIVRNAEKLIEPMDKMAAALSIIVRDKRGNVSVSE